MQQRRGMHELDRRGELDMAVAGIAGEARHRQGQHRRSRLPPEGNQWLATSGIIVTSEAGPRQDGRVDALHVGGDQGHQRFDDAPEGLSKGTITATPVSAFAILEGDNRKCHVMGRAWTHRVDYVAVTDRKRYCGNWFGPTTSCWFRRSARLLDGANIHHLVLDQNMSIIEGSLGILPRRILVHEEDNRAARQILTDAGLSHELRPDE